ncbi:hypothetical protein CC2G_014487 [Coprinopsis cinerea AmutBmut pab1-1]|nr:hypothetical protein CC2G_014487 [Coprinopsis cinerea AmutBmut pab1-1]
MSKSQIYRTYHKECNEAYPETLEFGEEDKLNRLRRILVPGVTIPVPLYFAGFMVSERYIRERCEREYGELRNFGGITDEAKFRWRD